MIQMINVVMGDSFGGGPPCMTSCLMYDNIINLYDRIVNSFCMVFCVFSRFFLLKASFFTTAAPSIAHDEGESS